MHTDRQLENLSHYAGPIVALLEDRKTLDVVVNADGALWVNRLGSGFEREGHFRSSAAKLLLSGIATVRQIPFDHDHPIIETIFPLTGDRIEGLMWPVVSSAVFAIRTRQKEIISSKVITSVSDPLNQKQHRDHFLEQLNGVRTHLEVLRLAVKYRRNMLVIGPTGSGKTTFANALIADWALQTPNDRVVVIEDTPEVQCSLPNHVQLVATAHVTQSELLTAALRLIPRRIVVGEVREEAAARVLLSAWNTGHTGSLTTIHADDAIGGLRRLENLLGGHSTAVRERIAAAVHLAVFIDGEESLAAARKLREIAVITGYDPATQDYRIQHV